MQNNEVYDEREKQKKRKKKKQSSVIKKWLITGVVFIVVSLLPVMIVGSLFLGTITSASSSIAEEYKVAASKINGSWQELLAFDTVRLENDFEDADPYKTAVEFLILEYKIYEEEDSEGDIILVLVEEGTLSYPEGIFRYLGLSNDSDINDIHAAAANLGSDDDELIYKISYISKDIEDVIQEHNFDDDDREWLGMLITEGILAEMFGDGSDLPGYVASAVNGYFAWPLPGIETERMTDSYGMRWHPIQHKYKFHYGTDISCPIGSPVISIEAGTVIAATYNGGNAGVMVKIRHEKDDCTWESKYFHLSEIKVSVGDKVDKGTVIAASGNTGGSTGPHLHIEILCNGSHTNPLPLITDNSQ